MAIQKKHGKGRLDKWYKLAKEKGYRARAAFKLIQLNKKYGFLEKSKVLLDLCAAPGSWCQVASEVMPAQSIIVGVDLAPIKPIPRAITFQSDITSDKCRATIRQHLKTWKADTVLHDGAPNVGIAWVQDAYSQAELVLQALKLATDFLIVGGTFVTKVFRSKDYNALLWVFQQLFTLVEATKPPSSRNVSAEIFVVCRGFKAPKRIDPKFLDPRHVFAELQDPTPNNEAKVFNPEKKKRKREGYEEGDYTQYKEISVAEFIQSTDPIAILGTVSRLSFEQGPNGDLALATLDRLSETTNEIRTCCADLKVLGRKEFRNLLRWRLKVRDKFGLSAKKRQEETEEGEEVVQVEPVNEEMKIQEELQRLHEQQSSRKKKERRKENERKQKEMIRLQMHMTTPYDIGMEQVGPNGDGAIFHLKSAVGVESGMRTASSDMEVPIVDPPSSESSGSEFESEDDEDGDKLDRELDMLYESYQRRKEDNDVKQRVKRARKEKETDDFEGFSGSENADASETEMEARQVLPLRPATANQGLSSRAANFFDQDLFQDLGISDGADDGDSAIEMNDDEDHEGAVTAQDHDRNEDDKGTASPGGSKSVQRRNESALETPFQELAKDRTSKAGGKTSISSGTADKLEDKLGPTEDIDPRKKNGQLDIDIITAEAMALAQSIATGEKTSADLTDDGFNKYAFRDVDGLPAWFLDDEDQHSKPQRPITAAAAAAIREKLRALNARPIKKVREAKGRKKLKAAQKLEKLRRKSSLLVDEEGMSERDKANTIARLMSRARKKKPKEKVKVVVARGGNKGIAGRPRGVKGRYKIVDKRLKKDVRAEKRLAKKRK